MWRFLVFPLLTSFAVLVETGVCLFLSSALATIILMPLGSPLNVSAFAYLPALVFEGLTRSVEPVETIWRYLLGAGFVVGLGLAGYETAPYKWAFLRGGLSYLVQNIFWFSLYISALNSALQGALFLIPSNKVLAPYINLLTQISFYGIGSLVVAIAGVYSIRSERVLTPKTLLHRIRHGRFKTTTF